MFTLYKSSPVYPRVIPVDLNGVHSYLAKFEESLRNFEELQREIKITRS